MANASTAWMPFVRPDKHKSAWLLDDGSVMLEPELETTSSQRRVRLKSAPAVADWMGSFDTFIYTAAKTAAEQQGRSLWMALGTPARPLSETPVGDSPYVEQASGEGWEPAKMYFLTGNSRYHQSTNVKWLFRHQTLPIEASLEVSIVKEYGDRFKIITEFTFPGTCPTDAHGAHSFSPKDRSASWNTLTNGLDRYSSGQTRLDEWIRTHPIDWVDGFAFGISHFSSERQALNEFAKILRAVQDLDAVEIPNLRLVTEQTNFNEPLDDKISMMPLHFYATTFTGELLDVCSDYLNGEPVIERIKETWALLQTHFRSLGMHVDDIKDSDWWRFVVEGADKAPLEINLKPVEDEQNEHSDSHAVKVNLATGTIVVACSLSATQEETSQAWEAALIRARLTGQDDELLAYAKEYAKRRNTVKAQELMDNALDRLKTEG